MVLTYTQKHYMKQVQRAVRVSGVQFQPLVGGAGWGVGLVMMEGGDPAGVSLPRDG